MAKTTAMVPAEQKRQEIYKQMPKPLRDIADSGMKKKAMFAKGWMMVAYDFGKMVAEVQANPERFSGVDTTVKPIPMLARYWKISEIILYDLQRMTTRLSREFVEAESLKPLPDGSELTQKHFVLLARVKDAANRRKLLAQIRAESLTANQVLALLRSGQYEQDESRTTGGRNPVMPTTGQATLQKVQSVTKTVNRFLKALTDTPQGTKVMRELESIPPAKVTEQSIAQLDAVAQEVAAARERLAAFETYLKSIRERSQRVLQEKHKDSGNGKPTRTKSTERRPETVAVGPPMAGGKKKKKKKRPPVAV